MGNYNPHNPEILGMEWVPIADTRTSYDTGTEWGYSFTVTGAPSTIVANAHFFYEQPASQMMGQTPFFSVYPKGSEDKTGQIQVLRLIADTVLVTGATSVGTSPVSSSMDGNYVLFDAAADRARFSFSLADTISVQTTLQFKRILGVDLVYQAAGTPGFALNANLETLTTKYPYGPFIVGPPSLDQTANLGTVRFGDVNPYWNSTATPNVNRYPFRWEEIARLGLSTTPRMFVGVDVDTLPLSGQVRLGFVALDIYYCAETRVRYGGKAIGTNFDANTFFETPIVSGVGQAVFQTTSLAAPAANLTPGEYTITSTLADAGDLWNGGDPMGMPRLREKYTIPSHPGVKITKFKRPSGVLPILPPTAELTHDIVGVSMTELDGTTATAVGEAAVTYFSIDGAPVFVNSSGTSIQAFQQVHNEADPANLTYEWVRFYARRLEPEAPGDLQVSINANTAVITAEEFAALDELTIGEYGPGTGWKEVTLALTSTFSSTGTFRNVVFDMINVATSNITDAYQILTTRTLFRPTAGESEEAIPGGDKARYDGLQNGNFFWLSPRNGVTPATSTNSTGIVMVSQAAPTVTGFTVTGSGCALDVQQVGTGCEDPSGCVPTHILGNGMSWIPLSSTSPAITGGTIEIQRMDDIDDDWATVAEIPFADSPSSFCDYEARAGMTSWYRIRVVNLLDFAGPWVTGSGILASPAVSGVGDGNSVLIFTSNRAPESSLAYVMQFGNDPIEEFGFPEAGFQQLRTQYQKDFFTAFRPLERGGEVFTRDILVNNVAIPPESLANFRSLRDLSWSTLPYVCVRDELGNRWFANVLVPTGRVRNNRTTYIAQVQITEVTDTPAPYEGS